jgi:hypothetical protein
MLITVTYLLKTVNEFMANSIIASVSLISSKLTLVIYYFAGPDGRVVLGVGVRSVVCWDCGIESLRGHGRLFLSSVLHCQVGVSASI